MLLNLRRSSRSPLVLFVTAAACTGGPGRGEFELREGDQVRFLAPGFGAEPRAGTVGRAGECISIMVPDQVPNPRRLEVVPVDSLTALHVQRPAGPRGEGGWVSVSVAAVKKRYGSCTPGG